VLLVRTATELGTAIGARKMGALLLALLRRGSAHFRHPIRRGNGRHQSRPWGVHQPVTGPPEHVSPRPEFVAMVLPTIPALAVGGDEDHTEQDDCEYQATEHKHQSLPSKAPWHPLRRVLKVLCRTLMRDLVLGEVLTMPICDGVTDAGMHPRVNLVIERWQLSVTPKNVMRSSPARSANCRLNSLRTGKASCSLNIVVPGCGSFGGSGTSRRQLHATLPEGRSPAPS